MWLRSLKLMALRSFDIVRTWQLHSLCHDLPAPIQLRLLHQYKLVRSTGGRPILRLGFPVPAPILPGRRRHLGPGSWPEDVVERRRELQEGR